MAPRDGSDDSGSNVGTLGEWLQGRGSYLWPSRIAGGCSVVGAATVVVAAATMQ